MTAARFLTHDKPASWRETLQQNRQPCMPFLLGTCVFAMADCFIEKSPHSCPAASPGRQTGSGDCGRKGRCHIVQYSHAVSIRWIPGAPRKRPSQQERRLRTKTLHQAAS